MDADRSIDLLITKSSLMSTIHYDANEMCNIPLMCDWLPASLFYDGKATWIMEQRQATANI